MQLPLQSISFPVFKRHRHGKTWMRIDSSAAMTEIRVLGNFYNVLEIHARILPERLLIEDLLRDEAGALETISKEEFDAFVERCGREKELRDF